MSIVAFNFLPTKPFLNINSPKSSLTPFSYKHKPKKPSSKAMTTTSNNSPITTIASHTGPNEPRKAADVLIEALEREGVTHVFAYPGGASIEIHQSLTKSKSINTILPRHEQGGILASVGYARASGNPSVCIATSGPGATNLVTGLADAMADSVPVIAITGQVARNLLGTDAFQEVPMTDMAKSITKHNYLVLDPNDIPRVVKEAFTIATTGRPGPVLIDIPKDVQQEMIVPRWLDHTMLQCYMSRLPKPPRIEAVHKIVDMIYEAKKPVLYIGGGCVNASEELRRFVKLTGIPVTSTLMGLGVFSSLDDLSLGMLGTHGVKQANYAVDKSDLLLGFGVRFDDRVTGKIESFASRAKIIHIDIDACELGKNKQPHVSMHCDIKFALHEINNNLAQKKEKPFFLEWMKELQKQKLNHFHSYNNPTNNNNDMIQPEYAIEVLEELTKGNAMITTGVGQHQIYVAHHYKFKSPRQFITSGGIGTMGYGLPAAIGAAVAKPRRLVIDVDGDGSFLMNIQELATIRAENIPVKIMILNNQHLGMVVQLEDVFYKGNRAQTFLGNPSNDYEDGGGVFPDMVKFAEACDIPGERVSKKSELSEAIKRMVKTQGPYLLDVVVPH